tara:strand:- start:562 stop:1800 length:1239 start_codon:yes stop_codon:yes gene_type:complete
MASAAQQGASPSGLAVESIDPVIARVLAPEERVYWQGRYTPKRLGPLNSLLMTAAVAAAAWWWFGQTGQLQAILAQLEQNREARNAILALFAAIVIGPLIFRRKRQWHHAITSERLLVLLNGKILEQPRPGDIVIIGRRPFGWIHWRYPHAGVRKAVRANPTHATSGLKCGRDDDPEAVLALLREWQERPTREAQANSEAFRRRAEAPREQPVQPQDLPSAVSEVISPQAGSLSLVNPQLGFAVDLPAPWELNVEQRFDGPLRVFGVTLLPRVVREGKKRRYQPGDSQPWNCLTSRGGPSVGVDIKAHHLGERELPTPESVANDRWAKVLGVVAFHMEEGIKMGEFSGFAVVRRMPAGVNLLGFGMLPVEVYLRQWWLQGPGLSLEIQGVAPTDAPVLQETVDLIVQSLRRA